MKPIEIKENHEGCSVIAAEQNEGFDNAVCSQAEACVNAFCELMNKKAKELGMNNSDFKDPAGCRNYSSAIDILRCFVRACQNKVIRDIWSKHDYSFKVYGDNARDIAIESKTLRGLGVERLKCKYNVLGGKGGTLTYQKINNSAILASRFDKDDEYACVIMGAEGANDCPNNRFDAVRMSLDAALNGDGGHVCAESSVVCKMPKSLDEQIVLLFEKNPEKVIMPASMSKILTALLVVEYISDIDTKVEVTEEIIALIPKGFYQKYIRAGDVIRIIDLMHIMMLPSSNAAAFVLAYYVGEKLLRL